MKRFKTCLKPFHKERQCRELVYLHESVPNNLVTWFNADREARERLLAYYHSLGDSCDAHTAAGATACRAAGCGWDELVSKCRVYHLPDSIFDDPMACDAVNQRGGYFGP